MLKSEFIKRTHYDPSDSEFSYIIESYCEFDGFKDAFCKQWAKDKKSGKWDVELKYRKLLDKEKRQFETKVAELESRLNRYQLFFEKVEKAKREVEG